MPNDTSRPIHLTKKECRTALLREYISKETGRPTDHIADDELHAMLEFGEKHVAWTTICRVLGLTKEFLSIERHDGQKRSAEEIEISHRQLQQAIAPGLRAGRAELLFKNLMKRSGFYRFGN